MRWRGTPWRFPKKNAYSLRPGVETPGRGRTGRAGAATLIVPPKCLLGICTHRPGRGASPANSPCLGAGFHFEKFKFYCPRSCPAGLPVLESPGSSCRTRELACQSPCGRWGASPAIPADRGDGSRFGLPGRGRAGVPHTTPCGAAVPARPPAHRVKFLPALS